MTPRILRALMAWAALCAAALSSGLSSADTITYYHNDLLGSPVVATNQSGDVLWRESYRPYGERLILEPGSANNKIWFTSRHENERTELIYMGARFYDPLIGRFLSVDPSRFDGANIHSFNRYAYANNNPYAFVDPDGKNPVLVWIAQATGAGYGMGVMADAASQGFAWGTIDWGMAATSNAARGGGEAGFFGGLGIGSAAIAPAGAGLAAASASELASAGAMARMEFRPSYHGAVGNALKSKGPTNGQLALDSSVLVKDTSPRRVGVDYASGEFVVFDRTINSIYHGHVRAWKELHPDMQRALRDAGMADRRGNIIGGP